jgi:HTH-type transcriptional regulator / antitoxin HigA
MVAVEEIETVWDRASAFLFVPHTEEEYRKLVSFLDDLIDEVGEDETHPLASLVELVGTLIERYEDEHVPEISE